MNGYSIALFVHLLAVLAATAASALALFAALCLRRSGSAAEARRWVSVTERVVPLFPVAVLLLVGTGGWMVHERWSWTTPWVVAALTGLGLIVALGNGIEGTRLRALKRELEASGWTPLARRLVRDPLSWSAKLATITLVVAVVFVMTVKPAAAGSVAAIVLALASGVALAVPFWRAPVAAVQDGELAGEPAS